MTCKKNCGYGGRGECSRNTSLSGQGENLYRDIKGNAPKVPLAEGVISTF